MKKFLVLIFIFFSGVIQASSFEERFNAAGELFNEQLFDSAAHGYESLINDGYLSAELFYNTGNCYFLTGNYILSTWYFIKARQLNPSDEQIAHNLSLSRSKLEYSPTGYELTDIPWMEMVVRQKSPDWYSWMTLILINAGFAGLLIIRFRQGLRLRLLFLVCSAVFITAGAMTGLLSWYAVKTLSDDTIGMVITDNASLYSAPSSTGTITQQLSPATILEVTESTESWYLVKNESVEGWIRKETIKLF